MTMVSVIMPVYNGEKYLREAIESILNQTFTDFEFLIVNDSSTDSSLETIQTYQDKRIRVINNKQNIGLTKSLNKAIKQVKGEYIARQDADDISLSNRFEEQIKYFGLYPEVMLLGTDFYEIDEQGKIVSAVVMPIRPSKSLLNGNQFVHGSIIIRKEALDKVGTYNELFRYGQDYELWLRIAKEFEVRNLSQVLYKFRLHKGNVRFQKTNEVILYHLLATRLAKNNLNKEILESIRIKGILNLYSYLTKHEKIYFHTAVANINMMNDNIKIARKQYWKAFSFGYFNIKNSMNILLSYLGKDIWTKTHKVYETKCRRE